jgi:predicted kinase
MNKKLIMCQGLPASGKSTWAREQVELGGTIRVSKDDIRTTLKREWNWQWSQANEQKDVIPQRDKMIIAGLNDPAIHTVISDDTNLQRPHKERLAQIAFEQKAEFVVKRFNTPVDVCVRRDATRTGDSHVGEKVIRDMAKKYMNDYSGLLPYVADKTLPSAIICDLDGTLADNKWRNPYDGSRCGEDPVIEPIRNILEVYYRFMDWRIVYLSGRDGEYRVQTEEFLRKNHCPPGGLFMRTAGDKRKDWIAKSELFDNHVRKVYNVKFVLDDRQQVVDMWRKLGLTCLQVADGNF